VSAAVFLAAALAFPFLSMKAGGLENVVTLPQSALDLYQHGRQILGVLVLGFIIVLPAVMIGAVLALLVPVVRGQHAAWLVPAGRLVFALAPWSMAEVFVIGVIVSLVKLASMADIVLGISFWSYVAFSVCFTAAISSLDRMYVWDSIEQVASG
jgi:paraquat-inducible protein A